MEEINLKELVRYYKSKIGLMIIIFILVVTGGILYLKIFKNNNYISSSSFVILDKEISNENIIYTNESLFLTSVEIMKSDRILKPVIENLNLDINKKELSENISYTITGETIAVQVKTHNENQTIQIANEIVNVFSEKIEEFYPNKKVVIIDKADKSNTISEQNDLKDIKKYILTGIFISIGIVFIAYYFPKLFSVLKEI